MLKALAMFLISASLVSAAFVREDFPFFTTNCDGYTLGAVYGGCNLGEIRYLQNGEVRVYYIPRFIEPPQQIVPVILTPPVEIPEPIVEPVPEIELPPIPKVSEVPEPGYISLILVAMAVMVFWRGYRGA